MATQQRALPLLVGLAAIWVCRGSPCTSNATIANSNRSSEATRCKGELGASCAYSCDKGFIPIGKHVCQTYAAGGMTFLNNTWFGGRCVKLCDRSGECPTGQLPLRYYENGAKCLTTRCFASEDDILRHIARGAYAVWQKSRSEKSGLYVDNIDLVSQKKNTMAATGVTGLGIIMEVVADALGWEDRVAQQKRVLGTLRTLAGETPGVAFPRSPGTGFSVHFLDAETGAANDMTSCMMCTGLQMAGVLFAKTYYEAVDPDSESTASISAFAQRLWNTTLFETLLCDDEKPTPVSSPTGTGIPMVQLFNKSCTGVQYPKDDGFYQFNEEHYTVWFAWARACAAAKREGKSCPQPAAQKMWDAWQGRRTAPNHDYDGHPLLSMWSGYIVHLPYYTTSTFNSLPEYEALFRSHWLADWDFYNTSAYAGERGRYGLGAGTTPRWCTGGSGYYADRIGEGSSYCRIYSPYITAGYLPADPERITPQLLDVLADGETVLPVPGTDLHVIWRRSMLDTDWVQGYGLTMVDFSSELLGLSTRWLGTQFYQNYTNHDFSLLQ